MPTRRHRKDFVHVRQEPNPPLAGNNRDLKDWHCIAILVSLVLVFFHNILLQNTFLWEDFLYQNFPFRNFAATTMASGELPLWNPYTFHGMPFLADIQTTVFYLPLTLLTLFVSGTSLNFYWLELVIILHYALAGISMFYLVKSFGLRRIPSLFAGVAYMLSGFMIVHAIHQQMITMVAWYPLVFLLFRRALTSPEWKWVFLTAIVLGHSIFAGYPQLSLYLFVFLLSVFLFEFFAAFQGRNIVSRSAAVMTFKAGAVVALAIALAMIQVLPTQELAGLSQRAQITYEKSSEGSLAWSQLLTLLYPKAYGSAGATGYNYFGPGTYWYYWETCIYLGVVPLLLSFLSIGARRKFRYAGFLWGVVIFAFLYSLGDNFILHRFFFQFVPGFSTFRNPARMGIFISLAISVLSAFALQHFIYGEARGTEQKNGRTTILLLLGIGILLWVLGISGGIESITRTKPNPQLLSAVRADYNISLFVLLLSLFAAWITVQRRVGPRTAIVVLGVVFMFDMWMFGGSQNNGQTNPAEYFRRTSQLVNFLKEEGKSEIFRVNTRNTDGMIMDRNQGMIDRIFMTEGYTPLALQRLYAPTATADVELDLLNVRYKTVTVDQSRSLSLQRRDTYLPRAFFLYQTHTAKTYDALLEYLKSPDFNYRTTALLEEEPEIQLKQLDTIPTWHATITSYHNNSILLDVATPEDGFLVLSETYYPGWKAYVDGKRTKVYQTDFNLRGLFVLKGTHLVEMRFEPDSFMRGAAISISSLLVCIFGIAGSHWRSTRKRALQQEGNS